MAPGAFCGFGVYELRVEVLIKSIVNKHTLKLRFGKHNFNHGLIFDTE
jgi:hypothetical protein